MDAKLYDSGGVRRFSDLRIQAAIDSALSAVKPESTFAAVAHHAFNVSGTGEKTNVTTVTFLVRLPAGFSVAAAAFKDWEHGDIGSEGRIVWEG